MDYDILDTIYENPLADEGDVAGFVMEGTAAVSFPRGRLRLENGLPVDGERSPHFLFWCPEVFPDDICLSWDFRPLREPGLAMMFFAAEGRDGKDLFDPSLAPRDGTYAHYHSGDIDALHASYLRRSAPEERAFRTCNLRKSRGFHLVCQGADPLPPVLDTDGDYRVRVVKAGAHVAFYVRDICAYHWVDPGDAFGPVRQGGRIGFRQMAPLMAEYANLRVDRIRLRRTRVTGDAA